MRPVVLDLTKAKKKKLQPYQAYLKLFKADLRPLIKENYDELVRSVSPDDPVPDRFSFTIEFARDLLSQETDEIKALVEQYRHAEAASDDDEDIKERDRKW